MPPCWVSRKKNRPLLFDYAADGSLGAPPLGDGLWFSIYLGATVADPAEDGLFARLHSGGDSLRQGLCVDAEPARPTRPETNTFFLLAVARACAGMGVPVLKMTASDHIIL